MSHVFHAFLHEWAFLVRALAVNRDAQFRNSQFAIRFRFWPLQKIRHVTRWLKVVDSPLSKTTPNTGRCCNWVHSVNTGPLTGNMLLPLCPLLWQHSVKQIYFLIKPLGAASIYQSPSLAAHIHTHQLFNCHPSITARISSINHPLQHFFFSSSIFAEPCLQLEADCCCCRLHSEVWSCKLVLIYYLSLSTSVHTIHVAAQLIPIQGRSTCLKYQWDILPSIAMVLMTPKSKFQNLIAIGSSMKLSIIFLLECDLVPAGILIHPGFFFFLKLSIFKSIPVELLYSIKWMDADSYLNISKMYFKFGQYFTLFYST